MALTALDLPELRYLSVSRVGVGQDVFEAVCASPWIGRLKDLHIEGSPSIVDLSPLLAVAKDLDPNITVRLEGHGAPTRQVEAIRAVLPETATLDVG